MTTCCFRLASHGNRSYAVPVHRNAPAELATPRGRHQEVKSCCKRRLASPQTPDWFLFCVRSERIGWINFKSDQARSADETFLLSYSAERQDQEALLLMKPGSWVQGHNGRLVVDPDPRRAWRARLQFSEI